MCLFLCLLSTIIVQRLAITFNKRYRSAFWDNWDAGSFFSVFPTLRDRR